MDEERFNLSLRKLLKQFGVTAQREVNGLPTDIVVEGRIDLS